MRDAARDAGAARPTAPPRAADHAALTRALLGRLFPDAPACGLSVRLWDGTRFGAAAGERRATLVLRHPGALRAALLPPSELALGEAYVYDDLDLEGDVETLVGLAGNLLSRPRGLGERATLARLLLALPRTRHPRRRDRDRTARVRGRLHSVRRDRAAVSHHYDLSNEFFALFLDERMVYSCAYFADADESLDTAQERKLEHVCRKLRLRPGERLLDVGCGWGALVAHAAARHGVEAVGITLSGRQAELARERLARAGLAGRTRIELRDYRELDEPGAYDAIASVGMFEHVGEARLPEYFRRAWKLLRPGGALLNHGIARAALAPRRPRRSFVGRYVFPDGELVPLATTVRAAEQAGFEVRDSESLREHYTLTLRRWVRRLEARRADAVAAAGEEAYRVWRLYMAGSAHGFDAGRLSVHQLLLVKPEGGRSGLPLTRADWYR